MDLPKNLAEMLKSAWMNIADLPTGIRECEAMLIVREREAATISDSIKARGAAEPEWAKKAKAAAHIKGLQANVLRVHLARLLDSVEAADRISNTRLAVTRAKLDAVLRIIEDFDDETQAEVKDAMAAAERMALSAH